MLKLYNTKSKRKEIFKPLHSDHVLMYACGPTVYHYAHIGNARASLCADLLYRTLLRRFESVRFVRNITDVDDKIINAAKVGGEAPQDIAKRFSSIYHEDMRALGNLLPSMEPFATHFVASMIKMIQKLIEKGAAYACEGHVLFSVKNDKFYGTLSRRALDEMQAGARVEIASFKRDPFDFVLWKPCAPEDEGQEGLGWESPWGYGRPGWHTECVSMIQDTLGPSVDIHMGGLDLLFPHHENEEAQARALNQGHSLARFWVHNGFVTFEKEKMSKSLGNVVYVHDILKSFSGATLRMALLATHYRQPLVWKAELLTHARNTLKTLFAPLEELNISLLDLSLHEPLDASLQVEEMSEFKEALDNDLNTPQAIGVLVRFAKKRDRVKNDPIFRGALLRALWDLGFSPTIIAEHVSRLVKKEYAAAHNAPWIEVQIEARRLARKCGDFKKADDIRKSLAEKGVSLKDTPHTTTWEMIDE